MINGDTVIIRNGAGGLLDRNFPPSPKPGINNVDRGAWRIEIESSLPSQQEYFLNVLNLATLIAGIQPSERYSITAVSHISPVSGYHIVVCQDPRGLVNSSSAGTINIPTGPTLSADTDGDGIGDSCDTNIVGGNLTSSSGGCSLAMNEKSVLDPMLLLLLFWSLIHFVLPDNAYYLMFLTLKGRGFSLC